MSAKSWPARTARQGHRPHPVANKVVIRMSDYRRNITHEPARIWGSGTSKGRIITCECGAVLGPSHEEPREVMAQHIAEAEQ